MVDMPTARRVMVDNQIRTFDVTDREVLAAFDVVPRDAFVAPGDKAIAYADRILTVGEASARRAMLPPLILARLIQALQPVAGERALDVAGGFGYSAAILASIGLDTTAVETDASLTEGARRRCPAGPYRQCRRERAGRGFRYHPDQRCDRMRAEGLLPAPERKWPPWRAVLRWSFGARVGLRQGEWQRQSAPRV